MCKRRCAGGGREHRVEVLAGMVGARGSSGGCGGALEPVEAAQPWLMQGLLLQAGLCPADDCGPQPSHQCCWFY